MAVQGIDEGAPLSAEPQLAESLTEALKSLKEGSGLLQEPIPPEGLSGMFAGLGIDDVRIFNATCIKQVFRKSSSFKYVHRNLEIIHFCQ